MDELDDSTPLLKGRIPPTSPSIPSRSNSFDSQSSHQSIRSLSNIVSSISTKVSTSISAFARDFSRPRSGTSASFDSTVTCNSEYCHLCLEHKSAGIKCKDDHFICRDQCFASLVLSLCEESYKLRQSKGKIQCPVPGCKSEAWLSRDVREGLAGHYSALDIYADTLLSFLESGSIAVGSQNSCAGSSKGSMGDELTDVERIKEMVCDSLTLKCPNPSCRFALDPNPDGCCAMKCLKCGCYFCWLCFMVTGIESQQAHTHVRKCSENPTSGSVFVSSTLVANVHKRRRLEAIRRTLLGASGNNWQKSAACNDGVQQAENVLKDSDITKTEIFASTAIAPPSPIEVPLLGLGGNNNNLVLDDDDRVAIMCQLFCYAFFILWGVLANFLDPDIELFTISMWDYLPFTFCSTAAVSVLISGCIYAHNAENDGCCVAVGTFCAMSIAIFAALVVLMAFTILFIQGVWYLFVTVLDYMFTISTPPKPPRVS